MAALRDRGRAVELIDGEIVEKAMPKPKHGRAQRKLGAVLDPFEGPIGGRRGPGGWWIMTEVEVFYAKRGEAFRHDLLGFRRDRVPEVPADVPVRERPDWICEILSPSTARYDLNQKRFTAHEHEVPHYWILDPENEALTVLRHGPDGYVVALAAGVGDVVNAPPFEAIAIDIGELFGHERE